MDFLEFKICSGYERRSLHAPDLKKLVASPTKIS